MLDRFSIPTLRGFTAQESGAKKASKEKAHETTLDAFEPSEANLEVLSNLGRMPRPWILWDLIPAKRDTL
jgi:hypothetical protein